MNKSNLLFVTAGIAMALSFQASSACAQTTTTPPPPTPTAVSTIVDKQALIKELLDVLNVDRMADAMRTNMATVMEKSMAAAMKADPDISSLTAHDQKLALAEAKWAARRVEELYSKQVDTKAMIRNLSYHLYDKYYTADDLRNLIAFYKSPTGQKAISLMPQITSDTLQMYSQTAMPKLQAIMTQVLNEESQRLRKDFNSPEPPKAKPHDID